MTASRNEDFSPQRGRPLSLLLAGVLFLLVLVFVIGLTLSYAAGCGAISASTPADKYAFMVVGTLAALAFALLGVIILRYQPGNRVGWLCLVGGIGLASTSFFDFYPNCALAGLVPGIGIEYLTLWNYTFGSLLTITPIFILLPLWFPDGRFLTPRFRKLTLAVLALMVVLTLAVVPVPDFRQSSATGFTIPLENPLGISQQPPWWGFYLGRALLLLILFASLLGVLSMILRLRRSRGVERQQMKWFAYFLATAVATQLIFFELAGALFGSNLEEGTLLFSVVNVLYAAILTIVFLGFPLTIGIAVFKYRLYDIDVIIRRTLVYGALTATLALVYFGSVILLQSLVTAVGGQQSAVAVVISTLLIAALFNPLRRRIQNDIDRRFFRRKYDAEKVVAAFSAGLRQELDPEQLSERLLAVVEETLQPESVSQWLKSTPKR